MMHVGHAHVHLGQHQQALAIFQQALDMCHLRFPENHPLIGTFSSLIPQIPVAFIFTAAGDVMVALSSSYSETGQVQEALAMSEKALALLRRTMPENHPNLGETNTIDCF